MLGLELELELGLGIVFTKAIRGKLYVKRWRVWFWLRQENLNTYSLRDRDSVRVRVRDEWFLKRLQFTFINFVYYCYYYCYYYCTYVSFNVCVSLCWQQLFHCIDMPVITGPYQRCAANLNNNNNNNTNNNNHSNYN